MKYQLFKYLKKTLTYLLYANVILYFVLSERKSYLKSVFESKEVKCQSLFFYYFILRTFPSNIFLIYFFKAVR